MCYFNIQSCTNCRAFISRPTRSQMPTNQESVSGFSLRESEGPYVRNTLPPVYFSLSPARNKAIMFKNVKQKSSFHKSRVRDNWSHVCPPAPFLHGREGNQLHRSINLILCNIKPLVYKTQALLKSTEELRPGPWGPNSNVFFAELKGGKTRPKINPNKEVCMLASDVDCNRDVNECPQIRRNYFPAWPRNKFTSSGWTI